MYRILFVLGLLCGLQVDAQYYNSALGLNGTALQDALHTIISTNHTQNTYSGLWTYYGSTDVKNGNELWDIYSDGNGVYTFTYSTEQCSGTLSPINEGDCYNREHTWPAYYFNDYYPMYADLFHVMPTDGVVNNKRSNFPYGKVNTIQWQSLNGSKLGAGSSYSNYSTSNPNHWEFEPIDSFKGDVARNYFYMSTRYKGQDASWYSWEMANGAALTPDAINLLLQWHHLDPVSQKEIDRNNAVFAIQNNRNPFIDYPIFADCIWGTQDCTSLGLSDISAKKHITCYPNPCREVIHVNNPTNEKINKINVYDLAGRKIQTISGTDLHDIHTEHFSIGLLLVECSTNKGSVLSREIIIKE